MGAEIGATTSIFAYDDATSRYLKATGREEIDDAARAVAHHLRADDEVLANPGDYFDQLIEIDLSTLEPLINGPHTPDLAHKLSEVGADGTANNWPVEISAALSVPAPTARTKTSPGQPASPAMPRRRG